MMDLKKLNIRKWSYAGNKLNNPLLIAWKLFWWIPLQISLLVTCLFALIGFGKDAAESIWNEIN